ncbi:metallophosphoesterase family protein [Natribaculum luteum]|uniref:Metallophosphoesterase family protein n=1 Tax=Natribaculum luteum TaxID=1586232 RepID=A0ABD5P0G8_9EURY|nr:metallophosphoesterase [Natribaculum luteum]
MLSNEGIAGTELVAFERPRSDGPVRFAIVGDPHVPVDENAHAKLYKPTTMLERVVEDCNHREFDYLFSVGDVTREGVREEFDALDDILDGLDVPFAAVPGNHDVPNEFDSHDGLPVGRFADRYAPDGLPFALDIDGLRVVGLDSSSAPEVADSHDGYIPESQLDWADDLLDEVSDAIVLVHHNLPAAVEQFDDYRKVADPTLGRPPVLRSPEGLVEVLSRHDISLVFSGHLHIPGMTTTGTVREVLVPSTCTYPQGYLVVEVDRSGTSVRFVPVSTPSEATAAFNRRCELGPKAAALSGMAAVRLATAPLTWEQ